jgi:hypothetical protein
MSRTIGILAVAAAFLGIAAPARAGFVVAGHPPAGALGLIAAGDDSAPHPLGYLYTINGLPDLVTRYDGPAAHGLTATGVTHASSVAGGTDMPAAATGMGVGEIIFSATGIRGYYYDSNGAHGFWHGRNSYPGRASPPAAGPQVGGLGAGVPSPGPVGSGSLLQPGLPLQSGVSAVPGPSGLVLAGTGAAILGVFVGRRKPPRVA